jgi:hypothetical protein
MMLRVGARLIQTPSGEEWRVGRRWLTRGLPRWRKVPAGKATAEALSMPDAGGPGDLAATMLIAVGAMVVAVIVIPLLLFGIELVVLGFLVAAAILGRSLLGRPWIVQARPLSDGAHLLTWKVSGWRRSGTLIDEVAVALASGRDPSPSEDAEVVAAGAR